MTESVAFFDQKIYKKTSTLKSAENCLQSVAVLKKYDLGALHLGLNLNQKCVYTLSAPPTAKAFQSVLFLDVKLLSSLPPPPPQCCSIPAPGLYCIHRFLRTGHI